MPIAIINIVAGRTEVQKRHLITNVTNAIADSLNAPLVSIRVLVQEVPPEHWGVGAETLVERGVKAVNSAALASS